MEQLNGFELAGRPMKVGHVTERNEASMASSFLSDELDLTGVEPGATGRLQLSVPPLSLPAQIGDGEATPPFTPADISHL